MSSVEIYPVVPKYQKENGVRVFDDEQIPFPEDFEVNERSTVRIPAGQIAGNHRHPRQEAYLTYEEGVELHWLDEHGGKHTEIMGEGESEVALFVIRSMVPHAIINTSNRSVTINGFADGPLEEVEHIDVTTKHEQKKGELSKEDITETTGLLSRLKPGVLPFPIFHEVTRLVTTPIVEVVPIRLLSTGEMEILLLQREFDDPVWPGQLHVPGTVVRAPILPVLFMMH